MHSQRTAQQWKTDDPDHLQLCELVLVSKNETRLHLTVRADPHETKGQNRLGT
jgi:hypothetical protein